MTSETSSAQIIKALVALGIARQAPVDEATLHVYLEGLRECDPGATVVACGELGRERRPDFGPLFPTLGDVITRSDEVAREWRMDWQAECQMLHGGRCGNVHFHAAKMAETLA